MRRMKWRWAYGLRAMVAIALLGGGTLTHGQTMPAAGDVAGPARTAIPEGEVVAVRVVTEDGRVLSDCPPGVAVEIGKALTRADVASSLKALYRTGDFSYLRAVTTAVPGGIRLDFIATENFFFNQ